MLTNKAKPGSIYVGQQSISSTTPKFSTIEVVVSYLSLLKE
jgi:hypothetical protein